MISIVIPAYNEEEYIGSCLEALVQQRTDQPFEVIMVDNTSTDATVTIAQRYCRRLNLRLLHESHKGRGAARAAGFAAARGDLILSTDADAVVPPTWVEEMAYHFRDARVAAVSGTCYITDLSPVKNMLFNHLQPVAMKLYRLVFGTYWLTGTNFGIRRRVYIASGGFNRQLNSQEDSQLSFKVRTLGTISYIARPAVRTSGRRFRKSLLAGLWDYIRTYLERYLLREQNPFMSDER